MFDAPSYLLGKKAGGGSTPVLQDKEVTITQNGESTVTKDSGYDGLNTVSITTNVPQPSGKITITENGTDIDVSSYASADVNVSGSSSKFAFVNGGGIIFWNDTRSDLQDEVDNIVENFDTTSITTMQSMFSFCQITSIDLSDFHTDNVTRMANTFSNCYNLTSINLSGLNTLKVTTMQGMFNDDSLLTTLDLSSFDTPNVTNVSYMFSGCKKLSSIDMRKFDFTNVTSSSNYSNMFGSSASYGPANNCLIIVKDNTAKTWITSKFSRLTNVKTVAEYEG